MRWDVLSVLTLAGSGTPKSVSRKAAKPRPVRKARRSGRPADRREHFPRQPLLERQGLGLVRTPEEEVEALFGDDLHWLVSSGGVNRFHPLPLVRNSLKKSCRIACLGIAQRNRNILRHKQRLSGFVAQHAHRGTAEQVGSHRAHALTSLSFIVPQNASHTFII